MNLPQILQVSLPVSDLERATFYRDILGTVFTASFDPPGLAFFDFAGVRLLLEKGEAGSIIYFAVDDIERRGRTAESRSFLRRFAAHDLRDDKGQFGPAGVEEWMVFFKDSEGNLLALSERRSAS